MSDKPTTRLPVHRGTQTDVLPRITQTDGIPRITPISGYATAAFIFALLGPYTLGSLSIVAVACAHYASHDTREGYRGGHFLTVAAMILGYITIAAIIAIGLLLTLGVVTR